MADTKYDGNPNAPLPGPTGSVDGWRMIALMLAESAEACLANAYWEVSVGSGDLKQWIKAARNKRSQELASPPNARAEARRDKPNV